RAIFTWQILPPAARDEHIEDAFDGPAVVGARPPGPRRRWEQRLDEGPLPIGEMNSGHVAMLYHLASVSASPLVEAISQMGGKLHPAGGCSKNGPDRRAVGGTRSPHRADVAPARWTRAAVARQPRGLERDPLDPADGGAMGRPAGVVSAIPD